eukprot:TRINITY_DN4684_c0_g1_i1.p1 TRINITY_DN4684_c0_g1~~TRINITY_DN4684_c0_g1_i1.p1  ORF type:complete len:220 (-),score=52.26 TRINITY_DN4684_c0_g1_i1:195-854(-)
MEVNEGTAQYDKSSETGRNNITLMLQSKRDIEQKMLQIRYADTSEEKDKKELKKLAEELMQLEVKLIEEVKGTTDVFYDQLNLKELHLEYIAEERRKTMSPPESKRKKSVLSPRSDPKAELPRPPSGSIGSSFFQMISDFFSPRTESLPTTSRDLVALEQEIAQLRASVYSLEQKKTLTKAQQKNLEDYKDQLRIRVAQREKISREEYVENQEDQYTDD